MAGTTQGGKKASEGGRGSREKASPAAVERYLKGIDLPANKKELIECAEDNGAPDDVLSVLSHLSEKEYATVIDITKEIGRIE